MPKCEFCQSEVTDTPARLAPEDVEWMKEVLHRKHRVSHGVALAYAAPTPEQIEARLQKFVFCSLDCALAAGAQSSLGSSV